MTSPNLRAEAAKVPEGEVSDHFTSMIDGSISEYNLQMYAVGRVEKALAHLRAKGGAS